MRVVMVAPDCAPAAKAGGLGDVESGLSRKLEIRGNTVEIILPKYASLQYSAIWDLELGYPDLWVPWYGGAVRCTVWSGKAHRRKFFFIEPHAAANTTPTTTPSSPRSAAASGLWSAHPREFRELAVNGMRTDYSWFRPGREYLDIYQNMRHTRELIMTRMGDEPSHSHPKTE